MAKVLLGKKTYQMTKEEAKGLLKIAGEAVPFGIYGLEKAGYIELRNDHPQSITKLKALIREYKRQGFKVYANGV